MSDVATDDRVLEIERLIKAPPERVFDAWVKPELLVKWWGPEGWDTPEHDMHVEKGGKWRTTMRSPQGDRHTVGGVYTTIERPNRLEFTWAWEQEDGSAGHETTVTVTLEPADGGTRMTLLQKMFQDNDARGNHDKGWVSSFVCLEQLVEQQAAA